LATSKVELGIQQKSQIERIL
ncbi:transposase, partial [Helicobacter pylori]|nr:transposase [Helicobacter pylori]NHB40525.1 transposase [Helicobacter pylori]NHB41074.1 transposase [Helicobacter pylori]NHB41427.1 transposase [Helicobacter pylori]NHB41584.1 transposase [Helicobacter pylori]